MYFERNERKEPLKEPLEVSVSPNGDLVAVTFAKEMQNRSEFASIQVRLSNFGFGLIE